MAYANSADPEGVVLSWSSLFAIPPHIYIYNCIKKKQENLDQNRLLNKV